MLIKAQTEEGMHSRLALSMGNNYSHVEGGKKILKTLQMDAKFLRKLGYNIR